MEKADSGGKGVFVIGTVKGDVHDIGKNLVDIILTNNGYEVHNIGIKQPLQAFVDKAKEVEADAIGMSGLLVKSTIIIRENSQELNTLGLAGTPVMLGGAALTRNYVEVDLRKVYEGRLFYGKDAFEGLHTMDTLMTGIKTGDLDPEFGRAEGGRKLAAPQVAAGGRRRAGRGPGPLGRGDRRPVFTPPFVGLGVAKGVSLDEIARATSTRRRCSATSGSSGPRAASPSGVQDRRLRPRLRALDEAKAEGWLVPAVGWGYFPVNSDGDDLVVWKDDDRREETAAVPLPAPAQGPLPLHLGLLPAAESGDADYAAFHVMTRRPRGEPRARSCSPRTSTRSTSSPTACRRDDRGAAPSCGTAASARSGASPTRTVRRSPGCSASSTAGPATRGATPRARTSRTR